MANDTECFVCILDICAYSWWKVFLDALHIFFNILGISHIRNMTGRYSLIDFPLLWAWGGVGGICVHVCVDSYVCVS